MKRELEKADACARARSQRVLERGERERESEDEFSKEVWNPNPIVFVFGANPENLKTLKACSSNQVLLGGSKQRYFFGGFFKLF
jgi:hypothetical protein